MQNRNEVKWAIMELWMQEVRDLEMKIQAEIEQKEKLELEIQKLREGSSFLDDDVPMYEKH